jgi:hypothetical protein
MAHAVDIQKLDKFLVRHMTDSVTVRHAFTSSLSQSAMHFPQSALCSKHRAMRTFSPSAVMMQGANALFVRRFAFILHSRSYSDVCNSFSLFVILPVLSTENQHGKHSNAKPCADNKCRNHTAPPDRSRMTSERSASISLACSLQSCRVKAFFSRVFLRSSRAHSAFCILCISS